METKGVFISPVLFWEKPVKILTLVEFLCWFLFWKVSSTQSQAAVGQNNKSIFLGNCVPPVPTSYLTNDLDPAVCDLLNKSSETPVV